MSRQLNVSVQTGDSKSAVVIHELADFTCPVSFSLFFEPMSGCNAAGTCGHTFEKKECVGKLQTCPCCRGDITFFTPAILTRNTLDQILLHHPKLLAEVYFNLDSFMEIFTKDNGLTTATGSRYLLLLENASNHLNDKAVEGTHSGKSPIEILVSTQSGRDLLRKKLKIASGKYFFGTAEIAIESL